MTIVKKETKNAPIAVAKTGKVVKKKDDKDDGKIRVLTPIGMLSFPYIARPDEGKKYSDGKYKTDLLIKKELFKTDPNGKKLRDAVLTVGRKYFDDQKLGLSDFKNPFKDMDNVEDPKEHEKGCILVRAKSNFPIAVFNPDMTLMDKEDVEGIKGGDFGRLVVVVAPYSQQGGGVTLYLQALQFAKKGESLGKGISSSLEMLEEIEEEIEDMPVEAGSPEEEEEDEDMKF